MAKKSKKPSKKISPPRRDAPDPVQDDAWDESFRKNKGKACLMEWSLVLDASLRSDLTRFDSLDFVGLNAEFVELLFPVVPGNGTVPPPDAALRTAVNVRWWRNLPQSVQDRLLADPPAFRGELCLNRLLQHQGVLVTEADAKWSAAKTTSHILTRTSAASDQRTVRGSAESASVEAAGDRRRLLIDVSSAASGASDDGSGRNEMKAIKSDVNERVTTKLVEYNGTVSGRDSSLTVTTVDSDASSRTLSTPSPPGVRISAVSPVPSSRSSPSLLESSTQARANSERQGVPLSTTPVVLRASQGPTEDRRLQTGSVAVGGASVSRLDPLKGDSMKPSPSPMPLLGSAEKNEVEEKRNEAAPQSVTGQSVSTSLSCYPTTARRVAEKIHELTDVKQMYPSFGTQLKKLVDCATSSWGEYVGSSNVLKRIQDSLAFDLSRQFQHLATTSQLGSILKECGMSLDDDRFTEDRLVGVRVEEMQLDALASIEGDNGKRTLTAWNEIWMFMASDGTERRTAVWLTENTFIVKLFDHQEVETVSRVLEASFFELECEVSIRRYQMKYSEMLLYQRRKAMNAPEKDRALKAIFQNLSLDPEVHFVLIEAVTAECLRTAESFSPNPNKRGTGSDLTSRALTEAPQRSISECWQKDTRLNASSAAIGSPLIDSCHENQIHRPLVLEGTRNTLRIHASSSDSEDYYRLFSTLSSNTLIRDVCVDVSTKSTSRWSQGQFDRFWKLLAKTVLTSERLVEIEIIFDN